MPLSSDDRWAIAELNARFAWILDTREYELLGEIFTTDAHYVSIGREFRSAQEIIASFKARTEARTTRHGLGNLLLTERSDGTVGGRGSWHTWASHSASPEGPVEAYMVADFDDRYRREQDVWRIAQRVITPVFRNAALAPDAEPYIWTEEEWMRRPAGGPRYRPSSTSTGLRTFPTMPDLTPDSRVERFVSRPPEELEAAQRELYDRIVGGPRAAQSGSVPIVDERGALVGPFGLMTIAPAVGDSVQGVGAALRFRSSLDPAVREGAILLVAAHHRCEFEWFAHAGAAAAAGLAEQQLSELHAGRLPAGLPQAQALALELVSALLARGALTDGEYRQATETLGEQQLAELVWLVGYYSMLALALAVFDPPNPLASRLHFGAGGRP